MEEVELCPICCQPFPPEPISEPPTSPLAPPAVAVEVPADPNPLPVPVSAAPPGWGEVAAVLAVGVFTPLSSAIGGLIQPPPTPSFWADAFNLTVSSATTSFVTLYLMGRSGESWERFGIVKPKVIDLLYGFGMLIVAVWIYQLMPNSWFTRDTSTPDPLPHAQAASELWAAGIMYMIAAFGEEVVTRAYLIPRLSTLFRSRAEAVVLAAVLFASYHFYNGFVTVIYAFFFGCAYGIAFLLLRRLWPLVIGHAMYNFLLELPAV